ncbi:hypothetical protein SASPL_103246 [Salvia splendens]|uniref:Uncharacterized protein n=1 Tax=Salvia splendens TaxID=180675 RepID=A0A8X8YV30_SALSN|nr:hypothetical protein SASPL_103246 [Salvia splendens]
MVSFSSFSIEEILGQIPGDPKNAVFLVLGRGIYVLYEDVKSCSCEDVHALWTLLVDSDANFT